MNLPKISPSLMCMDLTKFSEQILFLNQVADFYHIDIMDGHYVPNLALSNDFVKQLNTIAKIPIEIHFMVTDPNLFTSEGISFGAKLISVHPEVMAGKMFRFIDKVKSLGAQVGMVLNPDTDIKIMDAYLGEIDKVTVMTVDPGFAGQRFIPQMLHKVKALHDLKQKQKSANFVIEIDGGCNHKTFKKLISAGAESLVVGTSGLFNLAPQIDEAWAIMLTNLKHSLSR